MGANGENYGGFFGRAATDDTIRTNATNYSATEPVSNTKLAGFKDFDELESLLARIAATGGGQGNDCNELNKFLNRLGIKKAVCKKGNRVSDEDFQRISREIKRLQRKSTKKVLKWGPSARGGARRTRRKNRKGRKTRRS